MSKIIFLGVILLLMSFVLPGCGDSVQPVKNEVTVTLMPGQTADLGFDNLTLGFYRETRDVRCPQPNTCSWLGIAEIYVYLLQKPGHDPAYVPVAILGSALLDYGEIVKTPPYPHFGETEGVPGYVGPYQIRLLELTPHPVVGVIIDTTQYTATIKVTKMSGTTPPASEVKIGNLPPEQIMMDSVEVSNVSVDGNKLNLAVSYGGGDKNHYFWLFMSPNTFVETAPAQADLYLRHYDNEDMAKSIVLDTVAFDLSPIAALYRQIYGHNDSLKLNLYDYFSSGSGTFRSIIYRPK